MNAWACVLENSAPLSGDVRPLEVHGCQTGKIGEQFQAFVTDLCIVQIEIGEAGQASQQLHPGIADGSVLQMEPSDQ